jgi:uncharacterized protein
METHAPWIAPDRQVVQAYRAGRFTISGARHTGSVLVFPDKVLPWAPRAADEIDLASLDALRLVQPVPDILVVGVGATSALIAPELRRAIRQLGPAVEAMSTPSACRTYNVLLAEGRRVAAALIPVPADLGR